MWIVIPKLHLIASDKKAGKSDKSSGGKKIKEKEKNSKRSKPKNKAILKASNKKINNNKKLYRG